MEEIYILEIFDQYDEYNPWDIIGYTDDLEKARQWKDDPKFHGRRFRIVQKKELK